MEPDDERSRGASEETGQEDDTRNSSLKRTGAELERLNRLYAVLSSTNQALVNIHSQIGLFSQICRTAVEFGGFKLAWIGWLNTETRAVVPVARGLGRVRGRFAGARERDRLLRHAGAGQPAWGRGARGHGHFRAGAGLGADARGGVASRASNAKRRAVEAALGVGRGAPRARRVRRGGRRGRRAAWFGRDGHDGGRAWRVGWKANCSPTSLLVKPTVP